jgi:PPM family protein phosphatase
VRPPAEEAAASAPAVSTLERERTMTRRLPPIAPAEQAGHERPRRRRLRKALVALAVVGLVGVPLVFGVMLAVRSVYFVGAGEQGFVTVYRGLPYDLPLGIDLYQTNYVSPITVDQVPRGRRASVTDQELRSQNDAYDLVRRLELGQVNAVR